MAPRPYWKGYLKLSLVSCAVRLYSVTTRSERIAFHFLAPKTHHRIQMRPIFAPTGEGIDLTYLDRDNLKSEVLRCDVPKKQ